MKFNHNKKRNTAFMYEVLIVELSKSSMSNNISRKNKLMSMLKEYFSKGRALRKDLDIYKSFEDTSSLAPDTLINLVQEAKRQFHSLDRGSIYSQQTNLINKINKEIGHQTWSNFIPTYKRIATVNQVLNEGLSPKKQVLMEKKLVDLLSKPTSEKKPFPNVNNLAVKTFIEKFNKEYEQSLDNEQKILLEKYIMSPNDDGLEFKVYFYEEVDRLRNVIKEKISADVSTPAGLQKISDQMGAYNTRPLNRELITEVMRIQTLVREINS